MWLTKNFYPYEYRGDWEKLIERALPRREYFYSHHLNMENITDANYADAKRVCKGFKAKKLTEYLGLYVQSDTLLLVYSMTFRI